MVVDGGSGDGFDSFYLPSSRQIEFLHKKTLYARLVYRSLRTQFHRIELTSSAEKDQTKKLKRYCQLMSCVKIILMHKSFDLITVSTCRSKQN